MMVTFSKHKFTPGYRIADHPPVKPEDYDIQYTFENKIMKENDDIQIKMISNGYTVTMWQDGYEKVICFPTYDELMEWLKENLNG